MSSYVLFYENDSDREFIFYQINDFKRTKIENSLIFQAYF